LARERPPRPPVAPAPSPSDIVDTITAIAGQTNLLALNAAIERTVASVQADAARADRTGEVVASAREAFAAIAAAVEDVTTRAEEIAGAAAGLADAAAGLDRLVRRFTLA
jgi:methyl-accepting chemotaxis protein